MQTNKPTSLPASDLIWSSKHRQFLETRIVELQQKLREMRRVGGPDYNGSVRYQGRVEGQIGELQWILNQKV